MRPEELDPRIVPVPMSRLTDLRNDQTRVHLVSLICRPGLMKLLTMWEFVYFKPGTSNENRFQLLCVEWESETIVVASFPVEFFRKIDRFLEVSGLTVVDGIPTIITQGGVTPFPLHGPTVFTLENVPGHPCYGRLDWREGFPEEKAFCAWVRETGAARVPEILNGRPEADVWPGKRQGEDHEAA